MNNISITPKGGTVASEVSGSQVNLTAPSVVKLHLNQSDIKSFTRNGNDLVVTTKSGEVLVIHNFSQNDVKTCFSGFELNFHFRTFS